MIDRTLIAQGNSLGTIEGAGSIGAEVTTNLGDDAGLVGIFSSQLSNLIGFMTLLGGVFFLVYMLIAGFEWLRAGGDTGQVQKAQQRMINGAIGLMIMIIGVGIVGVVGGVFGLDLLNPGEVFLNLIP